MTVPLEVVAESPAGLAILTALDHDGELDVAIRSPDESEGEIVLSFAEFEWLVFYAGLQIVGAERERRRLARAARKGAAG